MVSPVNVELGNDKSVVDVFRVDVAARVEAFGTATLDTVVAAVDTEVASTDCDIGVNVDTPEELGNTNVCIVVVEFTGMLLVRV